MEIRRIKIILYVIVLFLIPSFSNIYGATLSKPVSNLGLQLYYTFDEGTSTQATDFSGNRRNGTLQNMSHPATASSGWGNGKVGKALNFDGSNDNVAFSGLTLGTNNTISVWIKPQTGADYQGIISDASGFNGLFYRDTTGLVSYYYSSADHHNNTAIQKNTWTHFVVVNNAGSVTFYVNGVSDGTSSAAPGYTPVNIGTAEPTTNEDFTGGIDEVRVYSRALTAGEVRKLYDLGTVKINSSQSNLIRNGLIGYWNMDSSYSRNSLVTDISSSGGTLSISGTPQKSIGKVGQSFNMDAVDDELFCTDANCGGTTGGKLDMGTRDWTAMAWVKPETGGTNCNIRGTVVGKVGDDEGGWYLGIGGQFICAEIRGGSFISSTLDGATVPLNEWSHIAVVFDRDGNMTRYLNGVQTGTQDNISANDGFSVDHPHNFCIGARDGTGTCNERLFDGSVDEVRIYERVLTASEINTLYKAGESKINMSQNNISGSSLNSGLVGLWSFNSKDLSDKVYDRSGQGNDGYLYNVATGSAKTIGKVGQALKFDGTDDLVLLGTQASLFPTSAITMSAWVKPNQDTGTFTIISNEDSAGTTGTIMRVQTAGQIRCTISNTASTFGSSIVSGKWSHVACVYDGANIITYIDGVSVGSASLTGSITYANSNTEPWRIGRRGSDAFPLHYDGSIDEVRIYNRALTASEMKQLYLLGR
jgi:hypothetical protein